MEDPRVLTGALIGEETGDIRLRRMTFIVSMSVFALVSAGWGVWEAVHYLHHASSVPTTELWLPWVCAIGCALCALVAVWWGHERQRLTGTPEN